MTGATTVTQAASILFRNTSFLGILPSQYTLNKLLKAHSNFSIRDVQDIGLDYARTLNDWLIAFDKARESLKPEGYVTSLPAWAYYLKYCEGGFLERAISAAQILMTKPGYRGPIIRQ